MLSETPEFLQKISCIFDSNKVTIKKNEVYVNAMLEMVTNSYA